LEEEGGGGEVEETAATRFSRRRALEEDRADMWAPHVGERGERMSGYCWGRFVGERKREEGGARSG
jgi:hypothetical protein